MSIQRYDMVDPYGSDGILQKDDDGDVVLYTDYAAEVERLKDKLHAVKGDRDGFMSALEKISAERDAAVRERDAAVEALREIIQKQTWAANTTVRNMAKIARAALAKIEGERNGQDG